MTRRVWSQAVVISVSNLKILIKDINSCCLVSFYDGAPLSRWCLSPGDSPSCRGWWGRARVMWPQHGPSPPTARQRTVLSFKLEFHHEMNLSGENILTCLIIERRNYQWLFIQTVSECWISQLIDLIILIMFLFSDIDECAIPELAAKCVENAECCNLPAEYVCKCRPGFEGDGQVECRGEPVDCVLLPLWLETGWEEEQAQSFTKGQGNKRMRGVGIR